MARKITKIPIKSQFSKEDFVIIATYLLDGHKKSIDTEDIAIKVNEIAPGRFTWRKYPQQINLELVSIRLRFAASSKQNNRSLLTGSTKTGWSLTTEGYGWAKKNKDLILKTNLNINDRGKRSGSIDSVRKDRETLRIKSTIAWDHWSRDEKNLISEREADEVLRTDSYATDRMIGVKVNRLKEICDEKSELKDFLNLIIKIKKN